MHKLVLLRHGLSDLKDTVERVIACWNETLSQEIRSGKRLLITGVMSK
jgi:bisphosphoglycerate-dependent phosphoglycerate mutase